MMGLLSITELSKVLNIHPNTLRNWEKQGKIIPQRTEGGHRRYDLKKVEAVLRVKCKTLVLLEKHEDLLKNKYERCVLEEYCKKNSYNSVSFLEKIDNDEEFLDVISQIEAGTVRFILMSDEHKLKRAQEIILQSTCETNLVKINRVNLKKCERELFPNLEEKQGL